MAAHHSWAQRGSYRVHDRFAPSNSGVPRWSMGDDDDKHRSSPFLPTWVMANPFFRKLRSLVQPSHLSWSYASSAPSSPLSTAPTLPSADTVRFTLLCSLWYMSSALSNNTGKSIMMQFRYPVTLTFVQFGFVAAYCLLFLSPAIRLSTLRPPTKAILKSTFPMGCFQVGGHIFSSMAISRIPVSTVHTIKALSPLFTVAAYALLFNVKYSAKTYFSLLPLTLGVMLACSFDTSASSTMGLICAFGSAIIFVTQNIFFKKIMPSNSSTTSHKLDKLNLLFYSSSMAFLLMIPIWLYTDLPVFLSSSHLPHAPEHTSGSLSIAYNFFLNGTVHFGQNVLAFILLARTSPVTYSIASLVKRVAVICCAIVWFNQRVYGVQGFGIALTFVGLWFYHGAKGDVDKGEKKVGRVVGAREVLLPRTWEDLGESETEKVQMEAAVELQSSRVPLRTGYSRPRSNSSHPSHHPPHSHYSHYASSHVPVPAPTPNPAPPASLSPRHPNAHPNLHILTGPTVSHPQTPTLDAVKEKVQQSPVDSYPSPPPSVDSPPDSPTRKEPSVFVPTQTFAPGSGPIGRGKNRRGTITAGSGPVGPARPAIAVAS